MPAKLPDDQNYLTVLLAEGGRGSFLFHRLEKGIPVNAFKVSDEMTESGDYERRHSI